MEEAQDKPMAKLVVEDIEGFKKLIGKPLPDGDWLQVTQEMINDFAKATMDYQWIHTDADKAASYSPYKRTVAHGFMSLSLVSKLLSDLVQVKSAKIGLNYGLNKVRFPHPVVVDSQIRVTGQILEVEDYGENGVKITWDITVENDQSPKPVCVAQFISLMFES